MLTTTKHVLKTSLIAAISLFFVVFSVVNRTTLHVSLFPLPYSADIPEFLFAIACFALGLIVGWAIVGLKLSRSQQLVISEHKHVMALQNEVALLHAGNAGTTLPVALPKS